MIFLLLISQAFGASNVVTSLNAVTTSFNTFTTLQTLQNMDRHSDTRGLEQWGGSIVWCSANSPTPKWGESSSGKLCIPRPKKMRTKKCGCS